MWEAMLPAAGQALPALLGGGGTRISTSVSNQSNIAFNPVLINDVGGSPSAAPAGHAWGEAPSYATSSGNDNVPSGSNPYAYLPTGSVGTGRTVAAPYGDQTLLPVAQQQAAQGGDSSMLMIGGAVLLVMLLMGKG